MFHGFVLNPGVSSELRQIAVSRIGGGSFEIREFIAREFRYSMNLFTVTLLFLSSIWIASRSKNKIIILLLGVFGLAHVLIFRQAGYYHEYLLFPLLPFISISSAAIIQRGINQLRSGMARLIGITVIILFVAGERLPYAKALLKSEYVKDIYEEAVEYGKIVKVNSDMIVPIERDVYFIFYADTVRKK